MTASHLLALLPPATLARRVVAFRAAHGIRDAAAVPHITVKARSGLGPDLAWQVPAQAVAAALQPVPLTLGGPRLFPGGRALYLQVHSSGAVGLHLALLTALNPAERFGSEGPGMTPHLSVALGRRGLKLDPVLEAAQATFADLEAHPLTFTATELVWLRKAGPGAVYLPVEAWPLGAG
ncbi:2'-5' RNA ligase family protein [Deinococcus arcticus]|uniref:Phosphoesterase n=1 Tax=Deinococcus arcticus TaxID=2136176 RepID=A0A2T3W9B0_9DEIO|nr:2'-5' RNA ligase family protein [Deinococcus arcticus]PTA68407.1 phosphoesterase [Deinococcus arcticus]